MVRILDYFSLGPNEVLIGTSEQIYELAFNIIKVKTMNLAYEQTRWERVLNNEEKQLIKEIVIESTDPVFLDIVFGHEIFIFEILRIYNDCCEEELALIDL